MPTASVERHSIAERGRQIYEASIRSRVEKDNRGRFVAIDVTSSDYEIDDDELPAFDRLIERHPDAAVYFQRVGYSVAAEIGGSVLGIDPK